MLPWQTEISRSTKMNKTKVKTEINIIKLNRHILEKK